MIGTISKLTNRLLARLPPSALTWGSVGKAAVAAWFFPFAACYAWFDTGGLPVLSCKLSDGYKTTFVTLYLMIAAPLLERAMHTTGGGNLNGALGGLVFLVVNVMSDLIVVLPIHRILFSDPSDYGEKARAAGLVEISIEHYATNLLPTYLPVLVMAWCSGRLFVRSGGDADVPAEPAGGTAKMDAPTEMKGKKTK
eukprot:CAMPEP_0180022488 /NCGR_PEP_ID=MMETSP0984-20121128/22896_1 /TAXON_ID=483367 /ORGANISM="non described non described, Strain CCMP 2436" /LENGTH=195 /DNA_ID=CAMNT_0021946551 /DNA_START=19 /DNA_END=606 /DNA_ORIENTATION=+